MLDNIAIIDILYYTEGMEKLCPRCNQVGLFRPQRGNKERLSTICATCEKQRHKRDHDRINNDPVQYAKRLARLKAYRARNRGKFLAYKAARRARKLRATPKWANVTKIGQIYNLANRERQMTGLNVNVDHIVPLKSDIVCGLHVEYNLQITIADYNNRKSNKVWPDMP